ncbi:glyoxalase superfamily protein [Aliivibrio fischeri]|uniref:glyoxalase superfamily protein n=1 Tax=Aliivibrio fischeri TaxID=668 RepID=UPI0006D19A58|nr:glyoxalase superfamily protein [Aliivibrio fischeri]USR96647.1 glyoxalase superfamily protein [Aliivibrio fischeri ATCC 7744 = JCM 18803 = DSM 507]GGK29814.1 lactoylglutathione lyase [Aliivibrio fischeri]
MTKLIHSMVRVHDLSASIKFYRDALELDIVNQYHFDDFSLTYLANSETGFELELTHNHNQDESYVHGNGYGHIAVSVDCIHTAHKRLNTYGINTSDIKSFGHEGVLLATFFFVIDPDGYKIEFIQRAGRYL